MTADFDDDGHYRLFSPAFYSTKRLWGGHVYREMGQNVRSAKWLKPTYGQIQDGGRHPNWKRL